jgi:hypothetical protein
MHSIMSASTFNKQPPPSAGRFGGEVMMTPYEEATRIVPLVDAALANSSTMGEWRDQSASTVTNNTTGEHHQVAVLADPIHDVDDRPPDEQPEGAAAADGSDEKPSRKERMTYLSNNNKRCLNTGIVVLAVLFAMALALIGICEASGSGAMCHRRKTPNNNNQPSMMPDNPVVVPSVFALAVHYENDAGLQCFRTRHDPHDGAGGSNECDRSSRGREQWYLRRTSFVLLASGQ